MWSVRGQKSSNADGFAMAFSLQHPKRTACGPRDHECPVSGAHVQGLFSHHLALGPLLAWVRGGQVSRLLPSETPRAQENSEALSVDGAAPVSVPEELQGPTPVWAHCRLWAMGRRAEG